MSAEPTFTFETELPAPTPAAALRTFLDAAEKAMDGVTIEFRRSMGQPGQPSVILTARGDAKTRPHTAYRTKEGA